jgi:hypothetical protein
VISTLTQPRLPDYRGTRALAGRRRGAPLGRGIDDRDRAPANCETSERGRRMIRSSLTAFALLVALAFAPANMVARTDADTLRRSSQL